MLATAPGVGARRQPGRSASAGAQLPASLSPRPLTTLSGPAVRHVWLIFPNVYLLMATSEQHTGTAKMKRLLSAADPRPLLDPAPFRIGDQEVPHARIADLLAPHLTPERKARIDAVVNARTATLATVVDGIVNTGNVSAVMRSSEALGVLPFHIITGDDTYKHSQRTSQGAEKWLDVRRWDASAACARSLQDEGYAVVAAHLDPEAVPIGRVDFSQKTALVFGNERDGVSPELLEVADRTCIVPMEGFTQSFNISVAAAVCLYHARQARGASHADLGDEEQVRLRAAYYLRSVGSAEEILKRKLA